jgi:ribonuclease-3
MNDDLHALQARVGHAFADPAHLLQALTHRSWAHENGGGDNERLEFLGDAVLQLCSTRALMARFPDAREGELSRLRSRIVSTQALAEVGRALELGPSLRLGIGEDQTGGRTRDRVLACATEAVLGALYEEAGLEACEAAVQRWLGDRIDRLQAQPGKGWKDPRSRLQELTQQGGRATPTYKVQKTEGPAHDLIFRVDVCLGETVLGHGEGRSKRIACKHAAEDALSRMEGA